ncbi:MAG: hypothetical protein KDB35_19750 [Acidimicrobiales bacterium]|nr:hypothetical protein [Acidimicrobiales bacterium]MCB1013586.1 hypothetical protein [Acidimicrobiales bacterium]MCB9371898.1 hypothetical protein [Microthrixaceae bacterium]
MTQSTTGRTELQEAVGRRVGYLVAAAVNLVALWVAGHLLDWGWPAFLTEGFDELLPWIAVSLVATAALNLVWVVADPDWFRHLGQFALHVVGFLVAVRTWQVFPFDFSGYSSGWETGMRVLIAVGIAGTAVAAVVELVASLRSWAERDPGRSRAGRGRHAGAAPA